MDELKQLVGNLIIEVKGLRDELRRTRWRGRLLSLVVAGMIALGVLYYNDTLHRRTATHNQIADLACFAVAATPVAQRSSEFIQELIKEYDCTHHRLPAGLSLPSPTTATVTTHATTTATHTKPVPGPTSTQTLQLPGGTATSTAPGPMRTILHTVTRTATHTRTVTVTRTPPICVPLPICR